MKSVRNPKRRFSATMPSRRRRRSRSHRRGGTKDHEVIDLTGSDHEESPRKRSSSLPSKHKRLFSSSYSSSTSTKKDHQNEVIDLVSDDEEEKRPMKNMKVSDDEKEKSPKKNIRVKANKYNQKVYVKESNIPNGGNGLFAKQDIQKGEVIATYGGQLIDPADARFADKTYIAEFEYGRGYKINGDNEDGDLGMFANSVGPAGEDETVHVEQNAAFDLMTKKILPNDRGRFDIRAKRKIHKDEEIIVNYGQGYWKHLTETIPTEQPQSKLDRDARAAKRRKKEDH